MRNSALSREEQEDQSVANHNRPTEPIKVVVEASYGGVTDEEMYKNSAAIFIGTVTNVSPMQWNQDSGEYWEDGLPVHYLKFQVDQTIVDSVEIGDSTETG